MEFVEVSKLTRKQVPWEQTLLIPLGDIQLQTNPDAVDISALKRTIQFGVDNNAYWIGMGDMIDMESPSNRRALHSSGFYDSVVDAIDAKAEELEQQIIDLLLPTKGRWIGLHEGHHYHVHQDGTTSDTRIAHALDAPFVGDAAYSRIEFKPPNNGNHGAIGFNIWSHHGEGNGQSAAAGLTKLERLTRGFEADIFLMGHTHKIAHTIVQTVRPVWGTQKGSLHHKYIHLVSTGSYLKGYVAQSKRDGRAGGLYPEKKMLNPLTLGSARIWFRPTWRTDGFTRSGYPVVDVTVEA